MKNTVLTLQQAKNENKKITMLTAYDYSTARLIDEAGVNMILSAILSATSCSATRTRCR